MWAIIYAPYTFIHSPSAKISANWDRMIFQLDFQVKDALIYYDDNFDIVIVSLSFTIFLIWIYTVVGRLYSVNLDWADYPWEDTVNKTFKYHDDFFNRGYPQHHFLQREVVASLFIPRLSQRLISSTFCGFKIYRSHTLIPDLN